MKEAAERERDPLETALKENFVGQEQAVHAVAASMPVLMQMSKIKSRFLRSLGRFQAVKFLKSVYSLPNDDVKLSYLRF